MGSGTSASSSGTSATSASTAAEEQIESSREAAARASRLLRSRELAATAQSATSPPRTSGSRGGPRGVGSGGRAGGARGDEGILVTSDAASRRGASRGGDGSGIGSGSPRGRDSLYSSLSNVTPPDRAAHSVAGGPVRMPNESWRAYRERLREERDAPADLSDPNGVTVTGAVSGRLGPGGGLTPSSVASSYSVNQNRFGTYSVVNRTGVS